MVKRIYESEKPVNEAANFEIKSDIVMKSLLQCVSNKGVEKTKELVDSIDKSVKAHANINSKLEEYVDMAELNLPDGHLPYAYNNKALDCSVEITGDPNQPKGPSVFVKLYASGEDGHAEYSYERQFNFYTDFPITVITANRLVALLERNPSHEEIIELCDRLAMRKVL